LGDGEFVTEFRVEFGTVQPGFREVSAPFILARLLPELQSGSTFVNRADAGGKIGNEWVYGKSSWSVAVPDIPKGPLPRTGF
jgi:hypothetical protein